MLLAPVLPALLNLWLDAFSTQERGLPTRTPTTLRESSRRLQCYLVLAKESTGPAIGDTSSTSLKLAALKPPEVQDDEAVAPSGQRDARAPSQESRAPEGGMGMVRREVVAERLAQEAVELAPGDTRPWQALAEACDAQGEGSSFRRLFVGCTPPGPRKKHAENS